MPSKNEEERLNLFNTFAKNLRIVSPDYDDVFLCPLCKELKPFTKEQINSELSLAHIWPDILGGTLKTLACKSCNSIMGSKIESHLANYFKSETEPLRARLYPNKNSKDSMGIKLNVSSKDNLHLDMEVIPGSYHPKLDTELNKWSTQKNQSFSIDVKQPFNSDTAKLACLHFAYLYLFHNFGYEWIFTPFAEKIRHQLNNPNQAIFKTLIIETPNEKTPGHETLISNLPYYFVIIKPKDRIGFMVASPELNHRPKHRMYVLFHIFSPEKHTLEFIDDYDQLGNYEMIISPYLTHFHKFLHVDEAPFLSKKVLYEVLLDFGIVQTVEEFEQLARMY